MRSKIIYSRAGVDIVTQPFLVGKPLEALALDASKDFARTLVVLWNSGYIFWIIFSRYLDFQERFFSIKRVCQKVRKNSEKGGIEFWLQSKYWYFLAQILRRFCR